MTTCSLVYYFKLNFVFESVLLLWLNTASVSSLSFVRGIDTFSFSIVPMLLLLVLDFLTTSRSMFCPFLVSIVVSLLVDLTCMESVPARAVLVIAVLGFSF